MTNIFSNVISAIKDDVMYSNASQLFQNMDAEQDIKDQELLDMIPVIAVRPR